MKMKKTFVEVSLAAMLAAGIAAPLVSSAQSVDDLQAQVNSLLAQITSITKQLNALLGKENGGTGVISTVPSEHRICKILYRSLALGMRGDDVSGLQEFLLKENYLTVEPTGYYGALTVEAVRKWQASQSITTAGVFGPISRDRIKVWCSEAAPMSAEPRNGEAPLVVTFTLQGERLASYTYALDFGDGTILESVPCSASSNTPGKCAVPLIVEHRYEKEGVYTATLWRSASGRIDVRTLAAKTNIRVSAPPVACTLEYNPVCGRPAGCANACPPGAYCARYCQPYPPKTYSNKCFLTAEGASLLHEGACNGSSGSQ